MPRIVLGLGFFFGGGVLTHLSPPIHLTQKGTSMSTTYWMHIKWTTLCCV